MRRCAAPFDAEAEEGVQGLYTDVVGPSDDALYDEPSATQGNRHVCKFVFCRAVWLHALWKGRERERKEFVACDCSVVDRRLGGQFVGC